MKDKDVINHRLEVSETMTQKMYVDQMVMQGQINNLSATVDGLKNYISDLERKLSEKADVTDIKQVVMQSEIIKKIDDRKSVGMDCKVGVSLDGRVVAESIVEHTADSIKCGVIQGSEINETR